MIDLTQDRLVNGLLKGFGGALSPHDIEARLQRDVVIRVPPERVVDLWPAVWALASVLERQVRGNIYLDTGFAAALPGPCQLGPRCIFGSSDDPSAVSVGLGFAEDDTPFDVVGDARLNRIGLHALHGPNPTAIECFALAGYVGYRVLAIALGVPPNRDWAVHPTLAVAYQSDLLDWELAASDGYTSVGVGQVGQAFLALLWFLHRGDFAGRRLALVDPDQFQTKNQRTQILLAEGAPWINAPKAKYIGCIAKTWNAEVKPIDTGITWEWQCDGLPAMGLVGPHDFEVRRMACMAGFSRIVECGVGTNLLAPRVSWHVIRGDTRSAKKLFPDLPLQQFEEIDDSEWTRQLKATPGECGWVQFKSISATAPCLGITVAAFALAELGRSEDVVRGSALLWSQLIPRFAEASTL